MAVTKIWAVKDSLSRLIDYAKNPDKTAFENLETVMAYAKNEDKVIFEEGETCYLVDALNCRGDPLESMMKVQKHFNARGENLAYHAYQSFKPGEVTPRQCHEIGVKLAEKIWGKRYQVLIATHMNCEHLHNHFVISAVSFRDGKKLDTGHNYWKRVLAPASDTICKEYGLSVLEHSGKAEPRPIYLDEKAGKKTPYRLMADALDAALNLATSASDLKKYLYDMGYELDIENEKIKSRFAKRWVTLKKLSETFKKDYRISAFDFHYEKNNFDIAMERFPHASSYTFEIKNRQERNGYYRNRDPLDAYSNNLNTFEVVLEVFMILMGWKPIRLPDGQEKTYTPMTPEMKAELRIARKKVEMYSRTAVILSREQFRNGKQVIDYLAATDNEINGIVRKRKQLYYKAGKQERAEDKQHYLNRIEALNDQLKQLRYDKKCLVNMLERGGVMKEMVANELRMRKEARERDFKPLSPVSEKPKSIQERIDALRRTPRPMPKKRDDDFER